jgi:hypothetical protein
MSASCSSNILACFTFVLNASQTRASSDNGERQPFILACFIFFCSWGTLQAPEPGWHVVTWGIKNWFHRLVRIDKL